MTSNQLFDLTGKVAVITGGNGGIGLGCAKGLAAAGASVAIWARSNEKSAAAVAELAALGVKAKSYEVDVKSVADLETATKATVADFGGIDILIANAGVNIRMRPEEYTDDIVDEIIDVNLKAVFHCAQLVYPEMKSAGEARSF